MDLSLPIIQLIKLSFQPPLDVDSVERYKQYFLKLSSRRCIYTLKGEYEINMHLQELDNVLYFQHKKNAPYRFQELLMRLSKQKLKRKQEIVHFLVQLSHVLKNEQNSTLESMFKPIDESSSHLQISQITQLKKSVIEVENLPPTQRNDANIKLIKQITEKGVYKFIIQQNSSINISEIDLVKDVIYCLQGIEGSYIGYDPIIDMFAVKKDIPLSVPTRKLINVICETGWMFKKIMQFIGTLTSSLIIQAIQTAIKDEMNEYYRIIAVLEGTLQNPQIQCKQIYQILEFTLRKIYQYVKKISQQLLQINIVISTIQSPNQMGSTSALALTLLIQYSQHGCPIISALFSRLLQAACIPLIRYINQWVFDGTIDDPVGEFFVETVDIRQQSRDCGWLWKNEFRVNQDKIPQIITLEQANKIFDTGRVVNWLRKQCNCKSWHLEQEVATIESLQTQKFQDWVIRANETTNKKLVQLLFNQFKFNMHMQAIKRYLLLGQGEFIHNLMEMLYDELSKPAVSVHKHNLISLLESAVRASNVQYLPAEVNLRLNIKMLEAAQNDTGWEVFCLDYTVDEPINTILNGKAMLMYFRIFNFLWRVKKVEFALCQCWKDHTKFDKNKYNIPNMRRAFDLSHKMLNEMQHFIKNFYSYVMVEAVESTWKKFLDDLESIQDLDSLINLHEKFLSEILENAFLTKKMEIYFLDIFKIFGLIFKFKAIQDELLNISKDIISEKQSDDVDEKLSQLISKQNRPKQQSFLNNQTQALLLICSQLTELRTSYQNQMLEFIDKLKKEDKLKFLQFKLDFSEFYFAQKSFKSNVMEDIKIMIQNKGETSQRSFSQKNLQFSNVSSLSPLYSNNNQRAQTQIIRDVPKPQIQKSLIDELKILDDPKKQFSQNKAKPPLVQIKTNPTLTDYERMKNEEQFSDSDNDDLI